MTQTFNKFSLESKLICSILSNFNIEMNKEQIKWLLDDFYKKEILSEKISVEQLDNLLLQLFKGNIIYNNNEKYSVSISYFPYAYRFPLSIDRDKYIQSIYSFTTYSEFSFEISCKLNNLSLLLMNLLAGKINNDDFTNFDFSFLNTNEPSLLQIILEPFNEEWFNLLPESSQIFFLNFAIHYELLNFKRLKSDNNQNIISYFLKPKWIKSDLFLNYASHNLALYLIFQGNFDRAKSYIDISTSIEAQAINAFYVYLFHGSDNAVNIYKNSLKLLQKQKNKRNVTFFSLAEIFYFISLLQEGSSDSLYDAKKYVEKLDKLNLIYRPAYSILYEFYLSRTIGKYSTENIIKNFSDSNCAFNRWLTCFISFWINFNDQEKILKDNVRNLLKSSKESGLNLVYFELLNLSEKLHISLNSSDYELLEKWNEKYIIPFVNRIEQKQKWELILDDLSSRLNLSINNTDYSIRLIWDLKLNIEEHSIKITPKEQQKLKNGNWSIGKPISIDTYFEDINPFPEYFNIQDKIIYKALQKARPWLTGITEQTWNLLPLLANCPNVYLNENYETSVEILKGQPVLILREKEEGFYFTFQPRYEGESIIPIMENEKRIKVFEFNNKQLLTASLLTEDQIFPKSSINRIKELITSLNSIMPVHSTIEGTKSITPIASIEASSKIYAQLEPIGEGLKIRFCTKPFGIHGSSFIPGKGEADVFSEIAGQSLHTHRDLLHEKELFNNILINNQIFLEKISDDCSALYNDAESSLELLLSLKNIPDLIIEWPENTKPRKVVAASFSNFSFKIKKDNDWFTLEGDLKIDENHVIDLQRILKYYQKGSRFIQVDDNQFLAITEEFRKKIEDIQAFTTSDNKQSIFHSSAIQLMDEILSKSKQVSFDRSWQEMLTHIKHANDKIFEVPKEFKAELRAYQKEGFKWLSRMSFLGMGSCLADDMGLGKTIEALSIITARVSEGPAFVLAPTSVCTNWYNECKRFSPTLNPILFAQSDRKETIKNLSQNDLIICSYGVLQREIENLININWSTVVLDEAQAIKNMSTNRSQAAMLLKGKFKMLMTGTPIENHLGELWNLFRFLNPGLLGSINSFNEKFAIPIQSFNDKKAQERLKKLVKPFILRRTKNQVLKDLPARTEVTLNVDLSKEEADLYESFRREAIENIKNAKSNNQKDSKPMIVLAEIMKLRRLCCNPSLVMPNMHIKSSKLSLLENITEELLASGHKALVFSQFVDHLTIIKNFFDEKGYKYQYLDGSTTIRARNKAIKGFQDGIGDFFLISLKAGGQGINLTAADYVIHMDPWWNPAVEDQASDRAHRIGQTRPVTIYKLITTNTIEEKIVQLHGKKRDLADGLLEGTDIAGKITTSELISLINNSALQSGQTH